MDMEPEFPTPEMDLINVAFRNIRFIGRLMQDPRVKLRHKLIPVAALVYVLKGKDLIPSQKHRVAGIADDAAVVHLASKLFYEQIPMDILKEHWDEVTK